MKNMMQWMLISFFCVFGLWLLAFGLLAAGIVFLLKALTLVLTPVVGLAGAYSASGIICLGGVVLVVVCVQFFLRQNTVARNASRNVPATMDTYESASLILKKYPLESVVLAFAAGLSANDIGELKKMAGTLLREGENG